MPRSVMNAVAELQSLIDENKDEIKSEGFYLALSNAALKIHERAAELDEDPDASDEEEENEEMMEEDWEDGDITALSLSQVMVDNVKLDEDDFADLVSGLHVHAFTKTRKPKARAMAIVELLNGLDLNDVGDAAKLRKWKNLVIALDGHGRFGYIARQHWLDDDYENEEDSDPRGYIMQIMELLIENDTHFRDLLRLRGNLRALKELVDQSSIDHLRDAARRVIAKLE